MSEIIIETQTTAVELCYRCWQFY